MHFVISMVKLHSVFWVGAIVISGLTLPAAARQASPPVAQSQPVRRDVLNACVQNRAETLPNPFTDVSPEHWAFKAVMTMYYCGAFRQATPLSLIEQLTNDPPQSQTRDRPSQSTID